MGQERKGKEGEELALYANSWIFPDCCTFFASPCTLNCISISDMLMVYISNITPYAQTGWPQK